MPRSCLFSRKLALRLERIRPAISNKNGRRERMHRTHAGDDARARPAREPIAAAGRGLPFHDSYVLLTACGRICMHRRKINVSTVQSVSGPTFSGMASTGGLEPPTPGFIPLRLPPPPQKERDVRGLDCPFTMALRPTGAARPVSTPSRQCRAWLGIG